MNTGVLVGKLILCMDAGCMCRGVYVSPYMGCVRGMCGVCVKHVQHVFVECLCVSVRVGICVCWEDVSLSKVCMCVDVQREKSMDVGVGYV